MAVLSKQLTFEVKQIGVDTDRTLRFVGSSESPDRDGDIIECAGWEMENYKKNPVFLFAHDYRQLPVGKAVNVFVEVESKQLVFEIKFATKEEYPFADTVYNLYKGGYMSATSVGFIGKQWEDRYIGEGSTRKWAGRTYKRQELLELSAVPVPANPEALVTARSKGVIQDGFEEMFPELKSAGTPVIIVTTTEEVKHWQCPHCSKKIGEKELYFDGKTFHHTPCNGPIELPGETGEKSFELVVDSTEKTVTVTDQNHKPLGKALISDEWKERLFDAPEQKAGATLSKKNKDALAQASALIQDVLASAEPASDEGGDSGADGEKSGVGVDIDLAAIEWPIKGPNEIDLKGIDPEQLRSIISETVSGALNTARGRI